MFSFPAPTVCGPATLRVDECRIIRETVPSPATPFQRRPQFRVTSNSASARQVAHRHLASRDVRAGFAYVECLRRTTLRRSLSSLEVAAARRARVRAVSLDGIPPVQWRNRPVAAGAPGTPSWARVPMLTTPAELLQRVCSSTFRRAKFRAMGDNRSTIPTPFSTNPSEGRPRFLSVQVSGQE